MYFLLERKRGTLEAMKGKFLDIVRLPNLIPVALPTELQGQMVIGVPSSIP